MADNRIAYGLARKYGIDTKGMSPKEVWDALKEKGVSQNNAGDKYSESGATPAERERMKYLGIKADKKDETLSEEERRVKEISDKTEGHDFTDADPKTFHRAISEAKASNSIDSRWRVDIHSEEDYKNDKLFVTKGGSCVAVEPGGNIISVCKNDADGNIRGKDLLKYAVDNGGDRLDAFGKKLYNFYTKYGFEPVSWTKFNEEYAPEDWKEARRQGYEVSAEPVIFYKYTGKRSDLSYEDFLNKEKAAEDYDAAMELRDKEITK